MATLVLYEFPLNERIRTFLRIEHLFNQLTFFHSNNSQWDHRIVIATLLEILAILSRIDLKSEVLKELERQENSLNKVMVNEGVNQLKLEELLQELRQYNDALYAMTGKLGLNLMENEFFKSITQRSTIPGGTCAFDLPVYHYWLHYPDVVRFEQIETWLAPFVTLRSAIDLLLKLIRFSVRPSQEIASAGFFQKNLDHNLPYQLLRISIPESIPCFAEISGGKHRFSVRFLNMGSVGERPIQLSDNVDFELACCLI